MRVVLFLGLALVATVSAYVEVRVGYHEEVGIPLAAKIKELEESDIADESFLSRIVGGVIAPIGAYPYLGGLIISFSNHGGSSVCGSSLVTANRLITAAHCWFDGRLQASQFVVALGTNRLHSGGTRIATRQVAMHPQWNHANLNNDIAVIYLPSRVPLSNIIQTISLPAWADSSNSFAGFWAIAAGYGMTSDQQTGVPNNQMISHVNLQVITTAQCQAVFGSVFARPSNICTNGAGGVGICGGDSGGPLVIFRNGRFILVGVSSFVSGSGCQRGHPSAFARITSFLNFIQSHL